MDNFSYTDNVRAAFASCLPCFAASHAEEPRLASTARAPSTSNDLEHLLRDPDSDVLSLHSNPGATSHRRARRRRRPKFSLTLFGYTLFGRPPIYLSDGDDDELPGTASGRTRASITASSSTLDSDAAPLDASTIERLTSPDHYAVLAAQRRRERQEGEEARQRAERRARRQERKARTRESTSMLLSDETGLPDDDTFEGFQGSGGGTRSLDFSHAAEVPSGGSHTERRGLEGDVDGSNASNSGDADDADLGGELYARKKSSAAPSASGSDSRSRTSASFSTGDASHVRTNAVGQTYQSIPYPHTDMHLPVGKKPRLVSKRTSTVSSATSQSTSTMPYTPPVGSLTESPAVAAFPVPQERYIRDGIHADFPSVGLSGAQRPKLDPRPFLVHQA